MSQLLQLDEGSEEEKVAKKALFTKHPQMMGTCFSLTCQLQIHDTCIIVVWLYIYIGFYFVADWPKEHDFRVFKLEIVNIFLINWYGGAKSTTVDEYLRCKS